MKYDTYAKQLRNQGGSKYFLQGTARLKTFSAAVQ